MTSDEILLDVEERMEKSIDHLKTSLAGIRTGRAHPGLVDSIKIDVYGSPAPIKTIAQVAAPEPTQIVIRPFDPTTIKDIEKGIMAADLGLNPQSDGRVVRINIPALSTEVRRKLVSRIKDLGEEAKISIRSVRRDGNKALDQAEKAKTVSEDERDEVKSEIQDLTKKFEDQVNKRLKQRESDVMED